MAITSLDRLNAADESTQTGNEITANDPWILQLDAAASAVSAHAQVLSGGAGFSFPDIGDGHPDNSALKFVDFTVSHLNEQRTKFVINGNYTNSSSVINQNSAINPLNVPTSYSYDQVDQQVPVLIDVETDDRILNFVGRPYSSPLTENKPLLRITVVRNERTYNSSKAEDLRNTVNKTPVRIDGETYSSGTAKLERFTGSSQFDQNGLTYYVITYQILINKDGFTRKILDRGTRDINNRPPPRSVLGADGAAFLDENGNFVSEGVEREWNTLEEKNWAGLRL